MSDTRQATATPSFAANAPAGEQPRAGIAVWIGCGVLLASLLLLLLLAGRAELAADARTRPLAERACALLGCSLPVWRDVGAFRMSGHALRSDPAAPGILQVSAGFRNDAPWPQDWPRLKLTLSDANGQALAERAFLPAEYLPAGHPPLIGSGQTASVQLAIHEPAREAVAFQFAFLPPP